MRIGRRSKAQVARVRERVFERDGHECVVFERASECAGGLTVQHRVGRGMGGSARLDGVENLVTMCAYHNALVESDALFRRLCVMRGYSVPRWAAGCVGSIPVEFLQGWMLISDVLTPVDSRQVVEVFEDVYGYHDVIDF